MRCLRKAVTWPGSASPIFSFYYGLPAAGVRVSPFTAVVAVLTLYNGSVLARGHPARLPDHLQRTLHYAKYLGVQPVLDRPLIPVAIVVAALYIALNLLLSMLATHLERRNRRSRRTVARPAMLDVE